ncbi:hypothetical protein evm_011928 [Chilo suppressalis]|nr:hypothetical protein evm_011928 [Chilo suppressalis]
MEGSEHHKQVVCHPPPRVGASTCVARHSTTRFTYDDNFADTQRYTSANLLVGRGVSMVGREPAARALRWKCRRRPTLRGCARQPNLHVRAAPTCAGALDHAQSDRLLYHVRAPDRQPRVERLPHSEAAQVETLPQPEARRDARQIRRRETEPYFVSVSVPCSKAPQSEPCVVMETFWLFTAQCAAGGYQAEATRLELIRSRCPERAASN